MILLIPICCQYTFKTKLDLLNLLHIVVSKRKDVGVGSASSCKSYCSTKSVEGNV